MGLIYLPRDDLFSTSGSLNLSQAYTIAFSNASVEYEAPRQSLKGEESILSCKRCGTAATLLTRHRRVLYDDLEALRSSLAV